MGHWEQTGRDNAEQRAKRAALPQWRRLLVDHARAGLVALSWIALCAGIWLALR